VEAGQCGPEAVAPLVARMEFPESWRLVLVIPRDKQGLHGPARVRPFNGCTAPARRRPVTDALCRLILLGMLPALAERDLEAFGEAVFDFNVRVGEMFAPVQSGIYASARLAEMVAFVRQQGIRGVGQSSWGPTVFAVVTDEERAADLAGRIRQRFVLEPSEVCCTTAYNHPASLERLPLDSD